MNETCKEEGLRGGRIDREYVEPEDNYIPMRSRKAKVYDDQIVVLPGQKDAYLNWLSKGGRIPTFNHGGHEHV